ncbi:SDR family oxidoreductase [Ferrimonas lipolytica]|uniref:SDR family oxidoreductase n=1 Tax=Ferrimonas lipolytica TaxID=2724191 RepID=A0A6H1UJ86_9GAMM|nr:SDR family NAD(P)-dependent oxidoreductase [Ferrimonas lipolytica]QIZ78888.1 SDR family oxidoreductase [Ferrimonas lipolytica]
MKIVGKVVVITGGAGGLGMAMAKRLGKLGAKLALVDINQAALDSVVTELATADIDAKAYACDITDEAQVEQLFGNIKQLQGSTSVLVNNAGLLRDGMLIKAKEGQLVDKMSLAQFRQVLAVNLDGTFLCGREAAAQMALAAEGGVIINISSVARAGNVGQSNYSASKAAVVALSNGWAKELSRHGIRSGSIAPGVIATEMVAAMKPEALARLEQAIPVGRVGQPDEVAAAVEYIIDSDYFTGRVLELDGGISM